MMKPDESLPSLEEFAKFSALASRIAGSALKKNAGLRDLPRFPKVLVETLNVVISSANFANPIELMYLYQYFDFDVIYKLNPNFHKYFFGQILASPRSFAPSCLWTLYWALVEAEHRFLWDYVPFRSHEERMTGHFVSQIIERIHDFSPHWPELVRFDGDSQDTHCRVIYADTATARREKYTGADVGLVIDAQLPNQNRFLKVARFQSKKADAGNAVIDLAQTKALLKHPELGYYLFYHLLAAGDPTPAPTVLTAATFKGEVEAAETSKSPEKELGKLSVNALASGGCDFAAFVTFQLADPNASAGLKVSSANGALNALFGLDSELDPVSRVMVIQLGANADGGEWEDAMSQFNSQSQ